MESVSISLKGWGTRVPLLIIPAAVVALFFDLAPAVRFGICWAAFAALVMLITVFVKAEYKAEGIRAIGKGLTVLLMCLGLSFGIFFFEEADQKAGFACFPLQDIGRYDVIATFIPIMRTIDGWGQTCNNLLGWMWPLNHMAYYWYFEAAELYNQAQEVTVAAYGEGNAGPVVVKSASGESVLGLSKLPAASVANWLPKPEYPGAVDITDVYRYADNGQEIVVIVPITGVSRSTTAAGKPMLRCETPTNFIIVSWSEGIVDRAEELRMKWAVVAGEIVRYQATYEIILGSWRQILELHPLTEV